MDKELEILRDYLRRQGLKQTAQREVILKVFLESPKHLTVDELAKRVQDEDSKVGYSTVYRSLKLFSECGLARESHFLHGRTIFEPAYQAQPHDHLVSMDEERVEEFHHDLLDAVQEKVCRRFGFAPEFRRMEIYGDFKEGGLEKKQGLERVMELLNDNLEHEMTMVSRYLHQSFLVNDKKYADVKANFMENAEESMEHATLLGEAIVAHGGEPVVKILEVFQPRGKSVPQMMREGLKLEREARENYVELEPLVEPWPELHKLISRLVKEESDHAREMETLIQNVEARN